MKSHNLTDIQTDERKAREPSQPSDGREKEYLKEGLSDYYGQLCSVCKADNGRHLRPSTYGKIGTTRIPGDAKPTKNLK